MSKYELHLIPTVKDNAIIGRIESSFQVNEALYLKGNLYYLNDLKDLLSKNGNMNVNVQPMHLHLTVCKRILKGMWCYNQESDSIYRAVENEDIDSTTTDTRIICTTDNELRQDVIVNTNDVIEENVPNFHPSFIVQYMILNNRDEALTDNIAPSIELRGKKLRPGYVVDENNIMTVLIKVFMPVKDIYTRAELDKHLLAVMNLGMGLRQSQLNGSDLRSGNDVLAEYKLNNL